MEAEVIERLDRIITLLEKLVTRLASDPTPKEDDGAIQLGPFMGDGGTIYRIRPGEQLSEQPEE